MGRVSYAAAVGPDSGRIDKPSHNLQNLLSLNLSKIRSLPVYDVTAKDVVCIEKLGTKPAFT
jgi:hypothetical protein